MLIPDFVQSIGWALSSYNIAHDGLSPGFACDVQGFFINVGDVGSSVWSLVIAVHTVLLLAGGQRIRIWAAEQSTSGHGRWIFCISIWISIIFLGLVGPLVVQRIYIETKGPFCINLYAMTANPSHGCRRGMVLDWRKLPPRTNLLPLL